MLFLVFSFRYALAVGLILLYSLANATVSSDDLCRGEADTKRAAAPDLCLARWKTTALKTRTVYRDYYNHCLCGNAHWFDSYLKCLKTKTTNRDWILNDKRRRCDGCDKDGIQTVNCTQQGNEDRISNVVPRVVIT
ncbi:BQ5605_C026g10152 [Microbotryum silenes-dioicae]|uniref:BQ5605_C026g10152 protein n=1 Tax=Microbotryum silenes-dioicae TaxID=796604 RepID=A0A2X0PMU9_9BASI|nr:BQ5605_C026g10152 [Microbotryum silenes-dioicae]